MTGTTKKQMSETQIHETNAQDGAEHAPLTRGQERMLIAAVMLGAFISVFNTTNINIALPSLMAYFHTDMETTQWAVVSYMLASGLIMPTVGYYMDKFSGRRLFLLALVCVAGASALCALAPTMELMIAARILQGLAGGVLLPVPGALVYQFIPQERQLMSISMVSMVSSFGVAIAPSLSGLLVEYLRWQAIFLVNVPLVIVDALLVWRFVPYKAFSSDAKLDGVGFVCASVGTVGLLLGFNQGSSFGWTSPFTILLLGGSVAVLIFFVWHELRVLQPMLNFRVFRYAGFTYSFALNTAVAIATSGGAMFMSIFLQTVSGFDAMHAGMAMFIPSMLMALMAPVAARGAERFSRRTVIFAGMAVLCVATWQMSRFTVSMTVVAFTLWLSLRYVGIGLVNPLVNNFAMASVPVRLVSHASAMFNWTRQLCSTIAVSMFSLIYTGHMARYWAQGMAAEEGAAMQSRFIECQAIDDVNFYTMLLLLFCVPLVYFLKESLLPKGHDHDAAA